MFINFREINDSLPTLDVLHALEIREYGHNSDQWRGECPYHRSSSRRPRSLSVSIQLRKFYCHRCKERGDLIDLWMHVRQTNCYAAVRELLGRFS